MQTCKRANVQTCKRANSSASQSRLPMNSRGFTLIEISIVLVIIGLIVGGVLVGSEMIANVRRHNLMKQLSEYKTATNTFRVKYNCLAGDCQNAYNFFGSAPDATPSNCNGNNDGYVEDSHNQTTNNEALRFWQHLSMADLIGGEYVGYGLPNNPGVTVPKVPFRNGGVNMNYTTTVLIEAPLLFPASSAGKQIYVIGSAGSPHMNFPLFTPSESLLIDKKYDDGFPDTGKIFTNQNAFSNWANTHLPNCKTGTEPSSTYNISHSGIACHLNIIEDIL